MHQRLRRLINSLAILSFIPFLLVLASCSGETQGPRETVSLNGEWMFAVDTGNVGIIEQWFSNGMPGERVVKVPHTWNVDDETEFHYGQAWYMKEFNVPASWLKKQMFIEFERVYHDARVWINGKRAFDHIGSGYTTFREDVTQYLLPGKRNRVAVLVDNSPGANTIPYMGSFDWAMDGGIIGHVNLVATGTPSVKNVLVHSDFIGTGEKYEGKLILETLLEQNIDFDGDIQFRVIIREENQQTSDIISEGIHQAKIAGNRYYIELELSSVRLWHFDDPNLYKLSLSPILEGRQTDEFETVFGFRKFNIQDGKLYLNNEHIRLTGVEWMPGSDTMHGMAEPDEYIERVIDDMKNANCIFTRFHWQQSKATIDLCNRKGILVQEEIPLWQQPVDFANPPLSDIAALHAEEMIMRDYNAPCIIAWGIGNELQSTLNSTKKSLFQLKAMVEKLDSNRIVSYVSNHVGENPEDDVSAYFDWIMMNDYYGTWFGKDAEAAGLALDKIHEIYPDKPVIISEWGLCEPRFTGGDERRVRDMEAHYAQYVERPYVQGYIYFNYNDYRTHMGEEGEGKLRRRVHGVVDHNLEHKPSYEMLKKLSAPVQLDHFTGDDGKLVLSFLVSHTLPSYTIRDYNVSVLNASSGEIVNEAVLDQTGPGEMVEYTMNVPLAGEYLIEVSRGTGHNVILQTIKLGEN